jgi:all-trans-retinol 13,14-reductase
VAALQHCSTGSRPGHDRPVPTADTGSQPGQAKKIMPAFTARSVFVSFGPWIVYGLLAATGHEVAACVGGLVSALFQMASQWRARRVKLLDGATLLFFGVGAVVTLVPHETLFLKYGSVLVWGTFALVAWGSLLAGAPFTSQYAQDVVPREYWDRPVFRRSNIVITAVWGAVFGANAALTAIASLGLSEVHRSVRVWLQLMPYVILVFGFVFTNRYQQWIRGSPTH